MCIIKSSQTIIALKWVILISKIHRGHFFPFNAVIALQFFTNDNIVFKTYIKYH